MLGLSTSLVKGGGIGRQYVKDGLKLYMPYKGADTTKGTQFVGTGSTSFDGDNDYVSVADDNTLDLVDHITICAWFKLDDTSNDNYAHIINKGDKYFIKQNGAASTLLVGFNDGSYRTATTEAFTEGKWHHVAMTYDEATIIPYLDGVAGTSTAIASTLSADSSALIIGAGDASSNFWEGNIKNVAIWNRALTATEVQNVMYKTYAEVSGRLGDSTLVAWWSLDGQVDSDGNAGSGYILDEVAGAGSTTNLGTITGATVDEDLYGGDTPVIPRAIDNAPTVQADAIGSGSALFDDTGEYINVGDVGSIKTLTFWLKPTAEITSSTTDKSIFGFRDHASDHYYGVQTGASTGVISGEVLAVLPDGSSRTGTNTTLNAGQWYHFAIVWNSSSNYFDIYTDGVLTTDLSSGTHSLENWTEFRIGKDESANDSLNCNMAQVGIWSSALDQAQIQSIMEKTYEELTASEKEDLVSYWALDETIESSGTGASFVLDKVDETTTQMFTNPDFTDNISTWDSATDNCSVAYSSGSLRQTSSSAADSKFAPSSSGFSDTTGAVRIEAKCTIISGTQTPRLRWIDGGNTNFFINTGTTVGAVTTFDFYTDGVYDEAFFTPQLIGENAGVADWDYIKITEYNGNTGQLI